MYERMAVVYRSQKMRTKLGNPEFYLGVLAVAVPMMLQQLIASSVNLVDNLMVGALGDAASHLARVLAPFTRQH